MRGGMTGVGRMLALASMCAALEAKPEQLTPTVFSGKHRRGGWSTRHKRRSHTYARSGARDGARYARQAERILAKGGKLPWEQGRVACSSCA